MNDFQKTWIPVHKITKTECGSRRKFQMNRPKGKKCPHGSKIAWMSNDEFEAALAEAATTGEECSSTSAVDAEAQLSDTPGNTSTPSEGQEFTQDTNDTSDASAPTVENS